MGADRRLARTLHPRSIALFGTGPAQRVIVQCQTLGFGGGLWPIHPTRETIAGVRCFRAVADLPHAPDVAFVAVNRHATIDVVAQLAKAGAGGAVCYASGFAESGTQAGVDGAALQQQLVEAAGAMPLLGPNCYGYINALDGVALWPDQHGCQPEAGGSAIVSQSGNVGLNLTLQQRGLNLAYMVTVGNQASAGIEDCLEVFIDDSRVTSIGLFVEAIVDPVRFARLAGTAAQRNLRIVALQTGRSAAGALIAASHTAALAGRRSAYAALFKRCGVAMVQSPAELIEALKLLNQGGVLTGSKLVSLSCSGGEASLMADLSEQTALRFEPFSSEHCQRISATLTELVTVGNPFDYHTFMWGDREATANTFTQVMNGPQDATLLLLDTPPRPDQQSDAWVGAAQALGAAAQATNRRGVVVATLPECVTADVRAAACAAKLVVLQGLHEALAALDAAAWLGANAPGAEPAAVVAPVQTKLIDEADAKVLLQKNGVTVPKGARCRCADVLATAKNIGYPITLKGLGLAHKSESGAVHVGLRNADELSAAVKKLPQKITECLVEQTITNVVAEILVSVRRDAPVGWLVTLGAGGVFTELWRDTACLLAPVSAADIRRSLESLRIFPLLTGFRGQPAGDINALVALTQSVILLALGNNLAEIEINPVLVTPNAAVAADAFMVAEQ
ncbi:acetate--CoA ligase [ADP-forming] II subunit beta [Anaerolineaceae bacterium]|nr:acetate--CoA ligase [ADP-forming] II subunit beta [Anaerolineaceae bacterium]